MACLTSEQIELLARDRLEARLAASLREHIAQCAGCRRTLDEWRAQEEVLWKLRDLPESKPVTVTERSPSPDGPGSPGQPNRDQPGLHLDSFAGYQILREIHRGGQGVVYQAFQKSTKRKVAIKVMREGPFASHADRARFEREVEILGQLNHPNVVAVHDSGEAAECSYFVMDYISGQSLDAWIAGQERAIDETLRLFAKICGAVNAAHLKGIIHRDLKPGNVRIDDHGEPHILDFGLAKVPRGAEAASLMTLTGQFMGSLPWASPEQAEAKPDKIDIRTDVYSLGVILYQMLTGKFPYDVLGNMRDVLDQIMKAEPTRPSTVRKHINDEVETIVLKCLCKERERRYQSAGELARDVGHYLAGEPIEAKRDSAWYVVRKSLRRHRAPSAVAAAFLALLMTGLSITSALYVRADAARREAEKERDRADNSKREAVLAKDDADTARRASEEQAAALRHQNYVNTIALAGQACDAGNATRADELLAACPEDLRNWEWRRLRWLCDRGVTRWPSEGVQVPGKALAISPNGRWALFQDTNRPDEAPLEVWDIEGARLVRRLSAMLRPAEWDPIAISADGQRVAIAELSQRTVRLWDCTSGMELSPVRLWPTPFWIGDVLLSSDGQRLAVTGFSLAQYVDTETRTVLWSGAAEYVRAVSANGRRILLEARQEGTLTVVDVDDAESIWSSAADPNNLSCAALSCDGTQVIMAENDGSLRLWILDVADFSSTWKVTARVEAVTFDASGSRVASSGQDGSLHVWDTRTGAELLTVSGPLAGSRDLAFSADGSCIITRNANGVIQLVHTKARPDVALSSLPSGVSTTIKASEDGRRIMFCDGASLQVIEVATGKELLYFTVAELLGRCTGGPAALLGVGAVPNASASHVGICISGGVVAMVACPSGETRVRKGTGQFVGLVGVSPSGRYLAWQEYTDAEHAPLYLWDTEADSLERLAPARRFGRGAFTADSQMLVMLGTDFGEPALTFFRCEDRTRLRSVASEPLAGRSWTRMALAPDSGSVALGDDAGRVRLLDAVTGGPRWTRPGHGLAVTSITFSPDGSRIASASADRTLKVWDTLAGSELVAWRDTEGVPHDIVFTATSIIAVGGATGKTTHMAEWTTTDFSASVVATLRQASEPRELVIRLLQELVLGQDVLDSLRTDEGLDDGLRTRALRLAAQHRDDPQKLNRAAWEVVKLLAQPDERYQHALRWAEAAATLNPDDGSIQNTLGVAQYRAGQYTEAVDTLRRSRALNFHVNGNAFAVPSDTAFLAMALYQLGQVDDARAELDRWRIILGPLRFLAGDETRAFLGEAEELIRGARTSQPSSESPEQPAVSPASSAAPVAVPPAWQSTAGHQQ